jgi:hypothetical protein
VGVVEVFCIRVLGVSFLVELGCFVGCFLGDPFGS